MGDRRSRKTICNWLLSFGVEIQKDTPFDERNIVNRWTGAR